MTEGTIRSTHSFFHSISSDSLARNLPYFYLAVFYVGKCHNYFLPSGRRLLFRVSKNVGESSPPFDPFMDEGGIYGTNVMRNFGLPKE